MLNKFRDFLKNYGVIGMAIAVIIGGKLNDFVSSLVNDLLLPFIFQPVLKSAGVEHIRQLNFRGMHYGRVLGSLIDFIIIALIVFVFAKFVLKEEKVTKK